MTYIEIFLAGAAIAGALVDINGVRHPMMWVYEIPTTSAIPDERCCLSKL